MKLPVEPVLRLIALGAVAGYRARHRLGMMAEWPTLALYWYGRERDPAAAVDPIFGRPLTFYLFTLPALELIAGWLTTLAVIVCASPSSSSSSAAASRVLGRLRGGPDAIGCAAGAAFRSRSASLLLALAAHVYLGRFERLFDDHTIFAGVTYTDAHVTLTGLHDRRGRAGPRRRRRVVNAVVGAASCAGSSPPSCRPSYVISSSRVVRLVRQRLHREAERAGARRPVHRAQHRDDARRRTAWIASRSVPFPADTGLEAVDAANNQATLQNIRLWDWRALQDTLRQIQEIRTYYDFPDIDIDRYEIDGTRPAGDARARAS